MLRGNIADIHAAHGDTAAADIPEGCNQLGNGGFAAAGWANQCVDRSLAESNVNAVQHLGVVVAKVNVTQFHGAALRCLCVRFGAGQFRSSQNVRHLTDDGVHLGQIVCELHATDDGRDQSHRKNNNENEFLRRQRSVFQQQPADGQHG